MFKISVVVPVYNTKKEYLIDCLNSIFHQTYKPYEIIVVNDGSTRKETLDVLKQLKDSDVILINQENKKISGALNAGIRIMKGDWWAGLSSDDMWFPNKLEEQVKFAKEHPEAKVIYANWIAVDHNGFFIQQINEHIFFNLKDQQDYLKHGYFSTWSNIFINKEVFEKVGLFNEEYPTSEDYEFTIRMSQYYLFYKVPKNLMMYRIHPEQLTETEWGWKGIKGRFYTNKAALLAHKLFGEKK